MVKSLELTVCPHRWRWLSCSAGRTCWPPPPLLMSRSLFHLPEPQTPDGRLPAVPAPQRWLTPPLHCLLDLLELPDWTKSLTLNELKKHFKRKNGTAQLVETSSVLYTAVSDVWVFCSSPRHLNFLQSALLTQHSSFKLKQNNVWLSVTLSWLN